MKSVRQLFLEGPSEGQEIGGWVRTHRQSKNVSFIELNDGSTHKGVQLVLAPDTNGYADVASRVTTGSSIRVKGDLVPSPAKGQQFEFRVEHLRLIGEADPETYPLQKKGHTLEFLREHLHLRGRSNTLSAAMKVRSKVSFAVHKFFQERGFYYIHTPIITTSDCEGAGAMFHVSTLDLAAVPKDDGKVNYQEDFFQEAAHLTVSGQLNAEIYATSLGLVYTFGPTFRAENSNTVRHLSEFWMIEPEMAFYELEENMQLAEDLVRYLIQYAFENCGDELEFLHGREWVDSGLGEALQQVLNKKFEVIDYTEAIKILEASGHSFEFPVRWGMDLQSEHERYLTDKHVRGPAIVINYPKEIKSFYMRLNADEKTVRAMDVLVPRLGEIIGGSQREERHDVLLAKTKAAGLPVEAYWWYLDLRRYGTVPHSGFGLGLERILMYITGIQNIRDVTPFPRFPGYAKF